VIDCRRVLKYTYVLGFFLKDHSAEKQLFEHHQEMLEKNTERLQEYTELPLDQIDRTQVRKSRVFGHSPARKKHAKSAKVVEHPKLTSFCIAVHASARLCPSSMYECTFVTPRFALCLTFCRFHRW
jgi:hypothetical protein